MQRCLRPFTRCRPHLLRLFTLEHARCSNQQLEPVPSRVEQDGRGTPAFSFESQNPPLRCPVWTRCGSGLIPGLRISQNERHSVISKGSPGLTRLHPWRSFHGNIAQKANEDEPHPMMYKPLAVDYEPLSDKQISEAHWNYAAQGYQAGLGPAFHELHEEIALKSKVLLKDMFEPSVLDIGSLRLQINGQPGLGVAEANEDAEVFVTDFATLGREQLLATLSRSERGSDITFFKADAEDLQFDADAFDLVTCCMVLGLCDYQTAIWDMFRVLKPGGSVIIVELGKEGEVDYYGPYLAALRAGLPFHASLPFNLGLHPDRLGAADALTASLEEEGFIDIRTERLTFSLHFGDSEEEVWECFQPHVMPMIRHIRSQRVGEEEEAAAAAVEETAKNAFLTALRAQGPSSERWFRDNVAHVYVASKEAESFWDFLKIPVPVIPKR